VRLATAATQNAGSFTRVAGLAEQLLTAICSTGREGMDNVTIELALLRVVRRQALMWREI
jgi:hypothetical protein